MEIKEDKEKKRHISLSIGCPNVVGGGHGAFKIEDQRFICDCGQDFTVEAEDLKKGLQQVLD